MRTKSFRSFLLLCFFTLIACDHEITGNDQPSDSSNKAQTVVADHVLYVSTQMQPTDEAGNDRSSITVRVRQRVAFVNRASCAITVWLPSELFGEGTYVLAKGSRVVLQVSELARGNTYPYSIAGCGPSAMGNPDIRVGEDCEDDENCD